MSDLIRIAVDAMGGDNSPQKVIDGIIHNHNNDKTSFYKIFGDEEKINDCIKNRLDNKFYEVIHTNKVVKSTDSPLEAAKRGKNSSMWLAIESVKKKEADIVISAGNTGALLAISYIVLRTIDGISRPAMTAYFPTMKGKTAMLDLGANIECDQKNLVDFALMGSAFSRIILKSSNPSVGLLNVGEESQKGTSRFMDQLHKS